MISSKDFFSALDALESEKRIKKDVFLEALQTALVIAYKKHSGTPKAVEVRLLPDSYKIKMFAYQTVVEEVEDREREISLEDARLISRKYKVGDRVSEEIHSKEFGRIAAQTAKQVIMQKIREVESETAYAELSQKEDELVTCVVRRVDGKNVYVEISKLEAALAPNDQMPNDRFNVGDRIKVYVKKIKAGQKGPQIAVTRANASFVKRLFELEVPEIHEGIVEIKSIAREAGNRTKISVESNDPDVEPIGACVGSKGARVNTIVNELGGEKIDIVGYSEDPTEYIASALAPSEVIEVQMNEDGKSCRVIVPDSQLSLAIGKEGQNVRLAARLTGYKIDIKPESQA